MAQKKEGQEKGKPGVKIQDLAPSKDAKGGAARNLEGGGNLNATRGQDGTRNQDATRGQNSFKNQD